MEANYFTTLQWVLSYIDKISHRVTCIPYPDPVILDGVGAVWGTREKVYGSLKVIVTQSCLTLCDPWTVASQAPTSMEFCRQEYWSGLPVPSPGDLPNPETEATPPTWQADSLPSEPLEKSYHMKWLGVL